MRELLLVDDDAGWRRVVAEDLAGLPYRLLEAGSAAEAIAILATNPELQVVLLDLDLGNSSGIEILERIQSQRERYRIVVLTGRDELLDADRAARYDVFAYLAKPDYVLAQSLRFTVDQAFKDLDRWKAERQLRLVLDVQRCIAADRPLAETLDQLCGAVRASVDAATCHVRVYDPGRGDYYLVGYRGDLALRRALERRRPESVFSGWLTPAAKPKIVDELALPRGSTAPTESGPSGPADLLEDPSFLTAIRGAYVVPVYTGFYPETLDAVLVVGADRPDFFTSERCATVNEFRDQLAFALGREWLQRQRNDLHEGFTKITDLLAELRFLSWKLPEIPELCRIVSQAVAEIVNAELVSVFLYDADTGLLSNIGEVNTGDNAAAPVEAYRPGESLTGGVFLQARSTKVLSESQSLQLPPPGTARGPVHEDPRVEGDADGVAISVVPSGVVLHYLGVPLLVGKNVRGVFRALNKKSLAYREADDPPDLLPRGFSNEDRIILELAATHLGVVIANAELLREKDRQAEQTRLLGELATERNAALSQLVGAVAHEINNTSGIIPANVDAIRKRLNPPPEVDRMLAMIEDAAAQATEFANEIAGFSATRSGVRQLLDINQVVSTAIVEMGPLLRPYECRLELALSDVAPVCEIFVTPFKQIVRNVVLNAFQAVDGREGAWVRVSTASSRDYAEVVVEDNGPGVRAEDRERIFDPDFTTKPWGNGLGLWLARTQLQAVGGSIALEMGRELGARFVVRIPARTRGDGSS